MGGAGRAASTFLKRLADKVATKKSATYAQALGWLRCRLSFALLRSSLLCLRGARSIRPSDAPPEPRRPDLAMVEAQIKSAQVSFSWNNVYNCVAILKLINWVFHICTYAIWHFFHCCWIATVLLCLVYTYFLFLSLSVIARCFVSFILVQFFFIHLCLCYSFL